MNFIPKIHRQESCENIQSLTWHEWGFLGCNFMFSSQSCLLFSLVKICFDVISHTIKSQNKNFIAEDGFIVNNDDSIYDNNSVTP